MGQAHVVPRPLKEWSLPDVSDNIALAWTAGGEILVSYLGKSRAHLDLYSSEGQLIRSISRESLPGFPSSIVTAPDGTMYMVVPSEGIFSARIEGDLLKWTKLGNAWQAADMRYMHSVEQLFLHEERLIVGGQIKVNSPGHGEVPAYCLRVFDPVRDAVLQSIICKDSDWWEGEQPSKLEEALARKGPLYHRDRSRNTEVYVAGPDPKGRLIVIPCAESAYLVRWNGTAYVKEEDSPLKGFMFEGAVYDRSSDRLIANAMNKVEIFNGSTGANIARFSLHHGFAAKSIALHNGVLAVLGQKDYHTYDACLYPVVAQTSSHSPTTTPTAVPNTVPATR